MKRPYLFLAGLLWLIPLFINASSLSENQIEAPTEKQKTPLAPYLQDLEELGYCIIPQVLSSPEAQLLYQRVWHEFIEKAWPDCQMDDRSNWKETFPMHNKMGVFAGPAGQIQAMWDLRQDPRIVDAFAQIWNTHDLIVSMDGLSFMCPPEIREGSIEPWPHVDQMILRQQDHLSLGNLPSMDFVSESSLKTQPYTIQGQFLFEDSFDGDGGFYCIPKSHLKFTTFAPQLETIQAMEIPKDEKRKIRHDFLNDFFGKSQDEEGNAYEKKHITAPRGSLILWDSRTIHWNQHANRPFSDTPKVRMVGYLCYVPKTRLTEEAKAMRREAFEIGVSTGHNPSPPELKYSKDHVYQEFERYLEDASYIQPKIKLTPLGQSLLGI